MKGILAKSLALVAVLAVAAVAQINEDLPIYDQAYLQLYGSSMEISYPLGRDFIGGGARAKGMGNAFLGVSDDVTAVSWNPAGLYRPDNPYEQPVMGLSYQSFATDATYRSRPYMDPEGRQFKYDDVANGVDFMSIVVPIRVKGHMFVGSIAYSRLDDEFYNAGMGFDVEMYFDEQDYLNDTPHPFHYQILDTYRTWVNALNVGFGTRIYDRVSFGLAINAYGGRSGSHTQETVTWEEFIIPGLPGEQRGTGVWTNNIYDTTTYSGVYFTLGMKYQGDRLSAGLIVKTPHTLKETIDVLVASKGFANGGEIAGTSSIVHVDDNVVELDQPLVLGGGLGYSLKDNWLMAFDVEYRGFAGGMVNRRDSLELVPDGTNVEYFTEFDPYWNNSWSFRVGTEYVWETGGRLFPYVPLRAGFGYVQIPSPDVDGVSLDVVDDFLAAEPITSTASSTKWSLGIGVRWSQIHLDLAYENSSVDRRNDYFLQESSVDNSKFNFMFTGYF